MGSVKLPSTAQALRRSDSNESDTPHDTQDNLIPSPDTSTPLIRTIDAADPRLWSINLGKGAKDGTDNSIHTTKYTLLSFLPISIYEQFRRLGNVYFLCISIIMFIGDTFPDVFPSSASYTTTLIPLIILISASLFLEASADLKKNSSDIKINSHPCVVLGRVEDIDSDCARVNDIMDGQDINVKLVTSLSASPGKSRNENTPRLKESDLKASIALVSVKREDIRTGDIVIVRNREMIPADIVLLGSSGENGGAYVETSQIDGETNLKLRKSPALPLGSFDVSTTSGLGLVKNYEHPKLENLLQAIKRVTRISLLGFPDGISALHNPNNSVLDNTGSILIAPSVLPSVRRNISRAFSSRKKIRNN